ncbi:MAG: hypothetical protein FWD81_00745 [Methanomassiliicoccaceae archaeon]|nr:hypothetical protein [Methanomassiliicoccaceae archaeon]
MGFKTDWSKYAAHSMIMKPKAPQYGNTQLGIAMTKALATLDDREKAGKIKPANANAYKGKIDSLKPLIGVDEDSGLLQVAQIIGSINRAL